MKDLHEMFVFPKLVIDEDGAVRQFSHPISLANSPAHAWESAQQFYMVDQRVAETSSCLGVVLSYIADDFSEIV